MSKKIYLIDDDSIIRLIMERSMNKLDNTLSFIQCENGKVGLEKLKENFEGDRSECIVLLDLNMPVLDGWGFLKAIQSYTPVTLQSMTLYILTSSTDKADIEKSKEYSCVNKFYHKPLSKSDIEDILS